MEWGPGQEMTKGDPAWPAHPNYGSCVPPTSANKAASIAVGYLKYFLI